VVVRDARHAAQVRRLEELLPKVIYTRVRQCMRVLRVSCVVPRRAQLRCVRSTRRRRRKKKGSHCTDAFEQVDWEDPEARIGGDRPVLPSVVATPAAIEGRLRVEEIAHHDLGRARRARVSGQASFFGEGGGRRTCMQRSVRLLVERSGGLVRSRHSVHERANPGILLANNRKLYKTCESRVCRVCVVCVSCVSWTEHRTCRRSSRTRLYRRCTSPPKSLRSVVCVSIQVCVCEKERALR
jgi:hypothetical protein